ncbi:MAG: Flp pilus assembly protein CpaB [Alphaproteobacteria bacterium]|nr:Flp pilus assembly protein CpaB [Alphaproteobacteria bacterium]
MSMTRILILVAALGAAGLAAFLVRGLVAGGPAPAQAVNIETTEVLVAAKAIPVGSKIMPGDLKWSGWPKNALDPSYMSHDAQPQALEDSTNGFIARAPLLPGEPVTGQKIVKADGAGFMAAVLTPGMRGVSVKVSAEMGAGGFILPNDRVDIILTRKLGNDDQGVPSFRSMTVLRSVRVLAIDQTAKEDGDSNSIVGKTATLEVSPKQAEVLALAESMGDLHLSLRSLSTPDQPDADGDARHAFGADDDANQITVFRWGAPSHTATAGSAKE